MDIYSKLLKYAVIKKDLEEIKFCLARGADVNQRLKPYNETFLHSTPPAEITKELLRFGADVNSKDNYGQTPLYTAIANRSDLAVVRELLLHGADINARDINGETPLHCAMIDGDGLEVIRELLRHGVDVNATDKAGKTALHLAVRWGDGTNLEVMKELLEFGADINCKDYTNALHEAIDRGYEQCVEFIIKMVVLNKFDERKIITSSEYLGMPISYRLLDYLKKCIYEVVQMKSYKVSGNQSLCDFVKKKGDTIKAFYPSIKINDEDISRNYPIYCDIIFTNIKLCMERAALLDEVKTLQIYSSNGSKSVVLNNDCLHNITEYLANDHLTAFLKAFKPQSSVLKVSQEADSGSDVGSYSKNDKFLRNSI